MASQALCVWYKLSWSCLHIFPKSLSGQGCLILHSSKAKTHCILEYDWDNANIVCSEHTFVISWEHWGDSGDNAPTEHKIVLPENYLRTHNNLRKHGMLCIV